VHEWVRRLRTRLVTHAGLVDEDKKYSVTVHYRHVRDKACARQAIANYDEPLFGLIVCALES
jgi:hypothetical protein